ncbi:MAG: hypothetical protein Kow0065_20480 [Methylomicrobium sp.]
MADNNPTNKNPSLSPVLQALTSAALVLPGLIGTPSNAADGDSVEFQYSRYEEGKRQLFNVPNNRKPIQVDSLHGAASASLTDRIQFAFQYTQDTWSGATPVATAPLAANPNRPVSTNTANGLITSGASPLLNTTVLLDKNLTPIPQDRLTGRLGDADRQLVHILSSASPETRRQGDFKLSYEWNEASLDIGGGLSLENDYESRYGSLGGHFDFNQKLTTLQWGASYTNSATRAILDPDASPYITKTAFAQQIQSINGSDILTGSKEDWSAQLAVSQVLSKTAFVDAGVGYTHSRGYMENPYKAMSVIFIDPKQLANPNSPYVNGDVRALLEKRPDTRNQWSFSGKYVQYLQPFDAALHLRYQFSHDDWGINSHVFEADWIQPLFDGWSITPRIRYYSQDAAHFYQPYLTTTQNFNRRATDAQGREIWIDANNPNNGVTYLRDENFNLIDADGRIVDENNLNVQPKIIGFDSTQLPADYSSDHRLSGFGALSGGITIAKQFAKGIQLEAGIEYYTHAGHLKLGGNGEEDFADFDYYAAHAALKVDLASLELRSTLSPHKSHHHHHSADGHSGHFVPSGVMWGHFMKEEDALMVGYRFTYGQQAGSLLNGTKTATDAAIVSDGCGTIQCRFAPRAMEMSMHMLHIMYAPTDWLNLMLMPMFMDMEMNLRELNGRPPALPGTHEHGGEGSHATGGVSDTLFSAQFAVFEKPGHLVHLGLGFSAPTGDVDLQYRRMFRADGGIQHFHMQLGSGTWDFLPSLTYNGEFDDWFWGGQLNGIKRLESRNESGYRLGDLFQASAWGGYKITHWLAASARGIYTVQGAIDGDFNTYNARSGPMDFPGNHGGRFWDIGFGLNASVPSGDFSGNQFSIEWLQPLVDDVNGFQLEREGTLNASWSFAF